MTDKTLVIGSRNWPKFLEPTFRFSDQMNWNKQWNFIKNILHNILLTTCSILRFMGKNTRVGSHSLLQGIFPTQGWSPGLLHSRQIPYHLSHQESSQSFIQILIQLSVGAKKSETVCYRKLFNVQKHNLSRENENCHRDIQKKGKVKTYQCKTDLLGSSLVLICLLLSLSLYYGLLPYFPHQHHWCTRNVLFYFLIYWISSKILLGYCF